MMDILDSSLRYLERVTKCMQDPFLEVPSMPRKRCLFGWALFLVEKNAVVMMLNYKSLVRESSLLSIIC